jgi:hypothetical protein
LQEHCGCHQAWGCDALRSGLTVSVSLATLSDVAREHLGGELRHSKVRVQLEMAVALCAGILGILTIFWRDWIEALTGWNPDQHNGGMEWIVVGVFLAVAVAMGLAACRHWKLLTPFPGK